MYSRNLISVLGCVGNDKFTRKSASVDEIFTFVWDFAVMMCVPKFLPIPSNPSSVPFLHETALEKRVETFSGFGWYRGYKNKKLKDFCVMATFYTPMVIRKYALAI